MPTKKAASDALAPNWLSRNLGINAEKTARRNPSAAWLKVRHMNGELRKRILMSPRTGIKRLLRPLPFSGIVLFLAVVVVAFVALSVVTLSLMRNFWIFFHPGNLVGKANKMRLRMRKSLKEWGREEMERERRNGARIEKKWMRSMNWQGEIQQSWGS